MLQKELKKIHSKKYRVGIIGMGYVGLPLAWTFHKNNMCITGFDIDKKKIDNLNAGVPYIKHIEKNIMISLAESKNCLFTLNFKELKNVDCIIMCVPTPLDKFRMPDMSYIESTVTVVAKHLKRGQLIILESTTYPGTTEEFIIPILESTSGLKSKEDFFVAYSPEREDPGNEHFDTAKIPKVVGGICDSSLKLACELYKTAINTVVPVDDTKTAEAVKLTENIFRSVNIALVNELKVIFNVMGINVNSVLDAADTKPFGFMKFTPGPGLGGHCIPIDPFYLTWKAREYNISTRFIELAGEINTDMPIYVIHNTIKVLNKFSKSLNGSKILIIGLAYKKDIDDMRESPTFKIFDLLTSRGADIDYFDPYIPIIKKSRSYAKYEGLKSIEFTKENIKKYDATIIATDHSSIDYLKLAKWSKCIVDTRNVFSKIKEEFKGKIFNS